METKLRKYQNMLVISSRGVILFSIWSFIKTTVYLFLASDWVYRDFAEGIDPLLEVLPEVWVYRIVTAVLLTICLIAMIGQIIIGRCGISEGTGRKTNRIVYLILIPFLIYCSITGILSLVESLTTYISESAAIVAILVEATTCWAEIDMLYAGIRVKQLRWKMKKMGV